MTVFSFLESRPASLPEGSRLYSLTFRPHHAQKNGLPADLASIAYAVDGPEAVAGASLVIPAEGQLMFERDGSGPGRGGVLRLLLNIRRPDISREQFAHHWRTVHAQLAIERNPHYDYYITNISTDPASVWDGVLQEWFPSEEAFVIHETGLQNVKKAVSDDYPLFLADSQECPQWLAVEIAD
ncbi:EthD domain-containing protein [Homoserinimonas hongtaonis]|uniref:EthD domain-containing protein n=1 Tax=Homoserinimonas hongtaonis TaxID=2079791 RepID=UPI00131F271E|nr:EthD domain-containing protein [Salinibacterium hongtaonis]